MITVKNKISIKIHLQTATLTIQEVYHQLTVALKPLQSTQNSITHSTKTQVMIHHQSKVETSVRVQAVKDIS
jgi:hypothetical protein